MLRKFAVLFLLLLATVSPTSAETQSPDPPHTVYLPLVGRNFYTGEPPLLISALYYDTYITGEPDEAFQIYNPLPVHRVTGGLEGHSRRSHGDVPARDHAERERQALVRPQGNGLSADVRRVARMRVRRR